MSSHSMMMGGGISMSNMVTGIFNFLFSTIFFILILFFEPKRPVVFGMEYNQQSGILECNWCYIFGSYIHGISIFL